MGQAFSPGHQRQNERQDSRFSKVLFEYYMLISTNINMYIKIVESYFIFNMIIFLLAIKVVSGTFI